MIFDILDLRYTSGSPYLELPRPDAPNLNTVEQGGNNVLGDPSPDSYCLTR